MSKTLAEIQKTIEDFMIVRKWENNDPNQLIASILIESGELAEHFQWKSTFKDYDEDKKREIGFEIVDVLVYLLRIANKSGIDDLAKYFDEKWSKLEEKYPVGQTREEYWATKKHYRETGKNKDYK